MDLGALAGYYYSDARFINNNDQIVGCAFNVNDERHACIFDASGGGANISLGTLPGYNYSEALCINDNGQILGIAYNNFGSLRPCLFDPTGNGNNIDLINQIDPSCGWVSGSVYGINNNGWIVGEVYNSAGEWHAILITPEPATILLFGLASLALRKKR
jgi:uncharacterized membrane protein